MRGSILFSKTMGEAYENHIDNGAPYNQVDTGLNEIFQLMLEREGLDLHCYRRNTVERRITSRLQKLRYQNYLEYASRLAEDPMESRHLLEHLTIKVSKFFRDADVFARLRKEVFPGLIQDKGSAGKLSLWSAGCGNGEEVYSLAILVEELKKDKTLFPEVEILGTDVDKAALSAAHRGTYPPTAVQEIPEELVATYFGKEQLRHISGFKVADILRREVKFKHLNLLSSTSFPGKLSFDLVLCRNVIIYFERQAQDRIFNLLATSVNQNGYLCLGEAEQLPRRYQSEFETIDRKAKIYRKTGPRSGGGGTGVA